MRKPPKCPTCGAPLPRRPDPALPSERDKRPDATREILRRLTVLEQRVAEQYDGSKGPNSNPVRTPSDAHRDGAIGAPPQTGAST